MAAMYGHTDVVKLLLTVAGMDINKADVHGQTPLYTASCNGHAAIVDLLLAAAEIDVNKANHENEQTPLFIAACSGHEAVVQRLIAVADINKPDINGSTPLFVAAEYGHTGVLRVLMGATGIEINKANKSGQSPLFISSSNGHPEDVSVLLSATEIDVNQVSNDGTKPIDVAKTEEIKEMLRNPADLALFFAAEAGDLIKVQSLVTTIDVNLIGVNGETAIYKAAKNGHKEVVQFLASHGGDLNIGNSKGWYPINVAAEYGQWELLPVLVSHGANIGNINCLGSNGETALYKAAEKGFVEVATFLADHGADATIASSKGVFPIDIAAENDFLPLLPVLATLGADLGKPLLMAAESKKVDVIIALFHLGVDHTIKDKDGKTCFDLLPAKDKLIILTQIELNLSLLEAYDFALWFVVIQIADNSDVLLAMVEALVSSHPTLAAAKDADGRAAVDVASKPMKLIIQSILLWHGRYRITESRPEHISATCFVFKAVDEHTIDKETGQPIKVALKLMRLRAQFQRELAARDKEFNQDYVMHILQTHPEVGSSTFDSWPDEVVDVDADATGQLTKTNAEKLYLLVMPLADRNLFVALKQERWAGKNMEEVRHVFVQLVHCVEDMHEKGVLHADLKTLNIVRTAGQWKLIDLDAACVIGKEPVGHKSSSAYVPPEAIYVDEKNDSACVRSVVAVTKGEANYELLMAHPSFDVWSLGCILYQMCTADVKPLFQGGQDDNLISDQNEDDSLFVLAKWSHWKKAKKLLRVDNPSARNLVGQMLHKDPLQRPTLARVLGHPFLSGKTVARLVGEKPKYDVFLSYRVASDTQHVEKLYNLLTTQGFKVYWDKHCLLPGMT